MNIATTKELKFGQGEFEKFLLDVLLEKGVVTDPKSQLSYRKSDNYNGGSTTIIAIVQNTTADVDSFISEYKPPINTPALKDPKTNPEQTIERSPIEQLDPT